MASYQPAEVRINAALAAPLYDARQGDDADSVPPGANSVSDDGEAEAERAAASDGPLTSRVHGVGYGWIKKE